MNALTQVHSLSTRLDGRLSDWGGGALSLAIRLYVGWQFLKSGMVKVADWDSTLALFRDEYMVPLLPPNLAALAGTIGELALPVLLFVGLFSRPAALGLFAVNLVAVLSYPALFKLECPAAVNDHFYWGVLLLVLVAFGPGRFSLDALLGRRAG